MYWSGIFAGVALGLVGGLAGLLLAFSTHGLTPLFGSPSLGAFSVYMASLLAPIASILAAVIALKKQVVFQMWVPEIAGILMLGGSLAMMGFVATDRISLLPAVACALGALILLLASDELKSAPSS